MLAACPALKPLQTPAALIDRRLSRCAACSASNEEEEIVTPKNKQARIQVQVGLHLPQIGQLISPTVVRVCTYYDEAIWLEE